jgi:hypothetical protein
MMSFYIIYCIDKYYAYYVHIDMLCICDLLCIYEDLLEEINYNTIQYTIMALNSCLFSVQLSNPHTSDSLEYYYFFIQVFWDVVLCHWASSFQAFNSTKILETSHTTHSTMQHHVPQNSNLHQNCCDSLTSHFMFHTFRIETSN